MSRKLPLLMGIALVGFAAVSLIQGDVHEALAQLGLGAGILSFWVEESGQARRGKLLSGFGLVLIGVSFVWAGDWVWVSIYAAVGGGALLAIFYRRVIA